MFLDSHCHFDMFENPLQVIKECERKEIITIGMTNLPSHFEMGFPHIKNYKYIRMALGLHPLMANVHKNELIKFKQNVDKTSYIGEIGLDFSKEGIETKDIQMRNFEFILDSIRNKRKIVSVHSRKAEKEVFELLKEYKIENVIFHWYSGNLTVLRQIIEKGYFFSINPSMIKSKTGQKLISEIPLDKILTETDSPYIKKNGSSIKPVDVKQVIDYLSEHYSISTEILKKQVYNNFMSLVNRIR